MRILVIEDETSIADAVKRGLIAEGYNVDIESRGDEGLWKAMAYDYDLIVLDIMLPGINGYQVCARLRADGDNTPVLMLTAKDGVYDEAEGLDTGADDYLVKPFDWVVLLARVRALLRRSNPNQPTPVLSVDDLYLDPQSHVVERCGTSIDLTPKEFALLRFLMHRVNHVITKSELLDHVWGELDNEDPNVVQVYIGYLRRKIDAPFGATTIKTVRGVGYRMVGGQR